MAERSTNGYCDPKSNNITNGDVNGDHPRMNGDYGPDEDIQAPYEPIAIIGCALRLPGGVSTDEALWELLDQKREGRCKVPHSRYNVEAFYGPGKPGHVCTKFGHFLEHVELDETDASFWSMTRKEIEETDPQQRIALEVAYECLQSSGATQWRGKNIGSYWGIFGEDWADMKAKETQHSGNYRITGYGDFAVANRVSYELGIQGPSMVIRTACSSSLIGLHEACLGLQRGECESAIVGGTNLLLNPHMTVAMSEQGVLSPGGRCMTFDEAADGYVRAEGIVAIHVKKLRDAIRDNDPIRAVIRSSCTNSDGKTAGLSLPNSEAHEALMRRSHELAGITDFSKTAMVECHGTGTQVGDPLEAMAVARAFGTSGIYIGSIKSNLGHSEGAAGVSSVIKAMLSLERRLIPPNINFRNPNPKISFEDYNLQVPVETTPWPKHKAERIGVNSYGIGGANAHVLIESAASNGIKAPVNDSPPSESHYLLTYSGSNAAAAKQSCQDNLAYLQTWPQRIADLSYTLNIRREPLSYRTFSVVSTDEECKALQSPPPERATEAYECVFVFTGQGAQWPQMGAALFASNNLFRATVEKMETFLQTLHDPPQWSLTEEILKSTKTSRINLPEFAQPGCMAILIGLVDVLRSWGVQPAGVVGHSGGETAGAYACGAITAEEAIKVAYYRGLATRNIETEGGMVAVGLGRAEVEPFLQKGVIIGCENSPNSVTLTGDTIPLESVAGAIKNARPDTLVRALRVDCAYHSHHMQPVAPKFITDQGAIHAKTPEVPFFSSVTGGLLDEGKLLNAEYWAQNLVSPVLFFQAVDSAVKHTKSPKLLLEIGPHSALAGPVRQTLKANSSIKTSYVSALVRNEHANSSLLNCAGTLFQHSVRFDLRAVTPDGRVLTDVPRYPWQREKHGSSESRLSTQWRQRQFSKHDILGARVVEASNSNPTWRNLLRLDDVPWIRDHLVLEDIVFPGAGYVAMAGEAIRQLTNSEDYTIQEMNIRNALVMDEGITVEVFTYLKPVRLTTTLDSTWYEFEISSLKGDQWTKHATGRVRSGSENKYEVPQIKPKRRIVDAAKWYSLMKRFGLNYGPRFRGLRNVTADPLKETAVTFVEDFVEEKESSYAMHPCTLDFAVQLFMVAAPKGLSRLFTNLALPTYIGELYIAPTSGEIAVEMDTTSNSKGSFWSDAVGTCGDRAVLRLKDLKLSKITDTSDSRGDDPHAAVDLVWKPDINFVDISKLMREEKDMRELSLEVEKMALACMVECSIMLKDKTPAHSFLDNYRRWLDSIYKEAGEGTFPNVANCQAIASMTSADRRSLIEKIHQNMGNTDIESVATAVYRLFYSMKTIFTGRIDALEILVQDDTLTKVYDFGRVSDLQDLFVLTAHSKPNMRVLEIGAGTGGTTTKILEYLNPKVPYAERNYYSYTYTDVSPGFFAAAKKRFGEYDALEFKVLDIAQDPVEQGFQAKSFDLIIASNVLHATPALTETLKNVRTLLADNGRLFLQELSPPIKWINFVMGTLPGWWLGEEDGRIEEPYVPPETWEKHLVDSGFDGIEAVHHDGQFNANIVAKPRTMVLPRKITLFVEDKTLQEVEKVVMALKEDGFEVDVRTWGEEIPALQDMVIFVDLEQPYVYNADEMRHQNMKDLLLLGKDRGILWVTGAAQVSCEDPRYSMTLGMARTLRTEMGIDLATLELESFDTAGWKALSSVLSSFQLRAGDGDLKPNMEWAFSNGQILTPKFHWISVNDQLSTKDQRATARKLDIEKRGFLNSLYWEPQVCEKPEDREVQIKTGAVGLTFRDVMIAMGIVEGQDVEGLGLGSDASGIVEAVGENVKDIEPGDRCLVLASGAFRTSMNVDRDLCVKIPDGLSLPEAASMPTVFCTTIHALMDLARVEKGMSVLIHSACGGIGLAAIQICQMIGAEIFCTVGSEEKFHHLVERYGIQRDHIFTSRDVSFKQSILRATNSRGVDVVLNSLSGELLHASWQCVADFGCMVEIGKRDLIGKATLNMDLFESNRSYFGVDLARITARRPAMAKRLLEKTMHLYDQGRIRPLAPITCFDGSHVDEAMRVMQKGSHIGKIVVEITDEIAQLSVRSPKQSFCLRKDCSYLLVGGLGGLGQAIAVWMAEAGATEIVFLSPSAGDQVRYAAFVEELEILGCRGILVPGSVVELGAIESAIEKATKPIRGVMQASMVLKDCSFEGMSFVDWEMAIKPKVEGTWNIHNAFMKHNIDLDFLILFSSWSGLVGQWGQANYAAANSFLDAFAQYRRAQGLAAATVDIGAMEDVGYVSRSAQLLEHFRMTSTHVLYEQDLLDSLHLMINRARPNASETDSTMVHDVGKAQFVSNGQLAIGLRSTQAIDAPTNRTVWKSDARTALYRNMESQASTTTQTGNEDLKQFLAEAASTPNILDNDSAATVLANEIGKTLFGFLMRDIDSLNLEDSPRSLGVDSLVSIELRSWFRSRLGFEITVLEILGSPSIRALGKFSAEKLKSKLVGGGHVKDEGEKASNSD